MKTYAWVALFGFIVGAVLFLLREHQAYILDILPWAILLLCPVLHIFMHRGHGKHGVLGTRNEGARETDWRKEDR
jgi:hypothetical protein